MWIESPVSPRMEFTLLIANDKTGLSKRTLLHVNLAISDIFCFNSSGVGRICQLEGVTSQAWQFSD